ncbi:hypothetical protein HYZ05_02010 [Candidatus Daviesbacteria bacterium]|nr:hypothetical protein [Candidatus Daviesbacteria bacterium]
MDKNLDPIYKEIINEFNKDLAQAFLTEQQGLRRTLCTKIEEERKRKSKRETKVITYYSKIEFPLQTEVMINQWDIKSIYSTLQELPVNCDIELIIHTSGGLPQKAKQIIEFLRARVGGRNKLRVVVPEIAKSAGTLIALGADRITMGLPSELGPIDPQVPRSSGGQIQYVPAWSYIDAFKHLQENSKDDQGNLKHEFYPLLASFDMPFYQICDNAVKETHQTAREFLSNGMFKRNRGVIEDIVSFFLYGSRPHEALINGREAQQKLGRSRLEILNENDTLWRLYWELHCRTCGLLDKTSIVKLVEHSNGVLVRQVQLSPTPN